ncbi:MAG: RDD family protein [Steroidobacteraceae bacterium]|jgi:uncharacterized RDD family membrane protein YckC|nr:RDD family protein [Steroidobacteraceae bacterium]
MTGAPELVIDSATGVEVALPVAGAGGRAYAFVIDWHIRVALALAWFGAGALLHAWATRGAPALEVPFDPGPSWFLGVVVPSAGLYFLYHPVLEIVLRGRTPGKRIAGLRIVTHDGSAPGPGALLVRNVFRLVDSFPAMYCVGLVAALVTRRHVRIGDLAAGTLLVYERERMPPLRDLPAAASPGATGAAPAARLAAPPEGLGATLARVELVEELLARWDQLAPAARGALARELLGRLGGAPQQLAGEDDATLRRSLESRAAAGAGPPA